MKMTKRIMTGLLAVSMFASAAFAIAIPSGKITGMWIGYSNSSLPACFTFYQGGKTYHVYAADFGSDNYKSTLSMLLLAWQNGYNVLGDYNITNNQNRVWDIAVQQ